MSQLGHAREVGVTGAWMRLAGGLGLYPHQARGIGWPGRCRPKGVELVVHVAATLQGNILLVPCSRDKEIKFDVPIILISILLSKVIEAIVWR